MKFDGIATYRKQLPKIINAFSSDKTESSIYLEFQAVATHATVWIDGKKIGEHLGGWTTWRVDITDSYHEGALVEVRVDERVGHNTQGFLPVFLPHFGGIWQSVNLIVVPKNRIEDLRLYAAGWMDADHIEFRIPIALSTLSHNECEVGVRIEALDGTNSDWTWTEIDADGIAKGTIAPKTIRRWTPQDPYRYPHRNCPPPSKISADHRCHEDDGFDSPNRSSGSKYSAQRSADRRSRRFELGLCSTAHRAFDLGRLYAERNHASQEDGFQPHEVLSLGSAEKVPRTLR